MSGDIIVTRGSISANRCIWLRNSLVELAVAEENGLRALHFSLQGEKNLFAELGDMTTGEAGNEYLLLGGHRLWHAPEWERRTYLPENRPVSVHQQGNSVEVRMDADDSGVSKGMRFDLAVGEPRVFVTHSLINEGLWEITLSPWAITQLKVGGTVLCPENRRIPETRMETPNRCWVYWPFTDITDTRIVYGNDLTRVLTTPGMPTKLGYLSTRGWLGYQIEGYRFTKHFAPDAHLRHPDMGCNAEIYLCNDFVELESLAPLTTLKPGETATHGEIWTLTRTDSLAGDGPAIIEAGEDIQDFSDLAASAGTPGPGERGGSTFWRKTSRGDSF